MRHLLLVSVVGACVALAGASDLTAQVRINGRVLDNQTLEPIAGVDVRISRASGRQVGRVHTNDEGRFSFLADRDGGYRFRAERIGYEGTETPTLWTDGFRVYAVEIRLDLDAVLVAPIEVIARSRLDASPVLENFQERARSGFGHYFTRDDIDRIRPSRVTDLLARVPGVRLESSGTGSRRAVYMSRGGGCRAEIFVDGFQWTPDIDLPSGSDPGFTVDDAVSPASVVGVEVYRGLSTVPPEFLTARANCGVVAIWTRRR